MIEVQFDIWSVLLILGVFQGLFILPLLLRKKTKASRWLAALVIIITLHIGNYLGVDLRLYHIWPHFLDLTLPLIFTIGPIYYFFIRSLLDRKFSLKWFDMLHFFPTIYFFWLNRGFYFSSGAFKIERIDVVLEMVNYEVDLSFLIPIGIHVGQTLCYILFANSQLKKVTTANPMDLKFKTWLQRFTYGFGIYWVFTFVWMLYLTLADGFFHEVDYIFVLSTSLVINVLAYAAVYHNREFSQYLLAFFAPKYTHSSLSPEQSKALMTKIMQLMEREKPYFNSELKISDIANCLSTSTNIISQVLNQEANKNFFEFVNEYRIAEAMKRLSDPQFAHISILGIAMDSGFSNKNTFNRLFKKHTGLTPTQFIRNAT